MGLRWLLVISILGDVVSFTILVLSMSLVIFRLLAMRRNNKVSLRGSGGI